MFFDGGRKAGGVYPTTTSAFPARRADVTAWVHENPHVEGLALPKSVGSGNLSLAQALPGGCRLDR
jgi:hypothetical protein